MTEYFPKIEIPKVNATPAEASAVAALAANDIPSRILAAEQGPVRLIIDADWGQDSDDVGALAVAHRLADLGECQIIAMANSFAQVQGCAGMSAVNVFYGRPDIPLGLGGTVESPNVYLAKGATYRNKIGTAVTPPTAVSVYRQALASSPDASVVWYVQGPMTILHGVYNSAADDISPLSGAQLMAQKLRELVVLGGFYPDGGSEYDFNSDPTSTQVINQLAGFPVTFQGFEVGYNCKTYSYQPDWSPIRGCYEAWRIYMGDGRTDNHSWGALGILYCVRGLGENFTYSAAGTCSVNGVGANTWTASASGNHKYLIKAKTNAQLAAILQPLQDALPLAVLTLDPYRTAWIEGTQATGGTTLIWDNLACNTLGGLEIVCRGKMAASDSLRLTFFAGAAAYSSRGQAVTVTYTGDGTGTVATTEITEATNLVDASDSYWSMVIRCLDPKSGWAPGVWEVMVSYRPAGTATTITRNCILNPNGYGMGDEVTKVRLHTASGSANIGDVYWKIRRI